MNFASEYVYAGAAETEFVSDEEYDYGMDVSDSGSEDEEANESKDEIDSAKKLPAAPTLPPLPTVPETRTMCASGSSSKSESEGEKSRAKKEKKVFSWKCGYQRAADAPSGGRSVAQAQQRTGRAFRRADTNVVSIRLNELVAPSNMHAGDPVYCSKCQSIISKNSKLILDGTEKVWQCDFCGERNLVDIEDEEVPGMDDVTYLVEPAPATTASGPSGLDESLVIFCVDISGSMCVTTEVPGQLKLRGSGGLRRLQTLNDTREDQFLPRQNRNVTYVSRLQAVQAAVDHQLEEMQKDHPSRRVGLITFDNEVTVIGDGTLTETSIVGDKLKSKEALVQMGAEFDLPKPVKESRKSLGDKLFSLEEGGATALGPALVIAVSLASRHSGSKVIVCTDGMANIGMGKLDEGSSNTDGHSESFYENIGTTAMEKGVAISVVTIKGTDCKLVELGKIADRTGGQVNIVDPLKLTQEFSTILADRIIATNVVATFILHKQLYIQDPNVETKESRAVREVGNVTCDTEITFEYALRTENMHSTTAAQHQGTDTGSGAEAGSPSTSAGGRDETDTPKELPFQLQIRYTDTEGMKALRVLTQYKPVTRDRNVAEKDIDLLVLGTHAAQRTAHLALQGEYTMSRGAALMNQRLAWRSAQREADNPTKKAWYRKIFGKIKSVDHHVANAQVSERQRFGTTYSDDEDDMDTSEPAAAEVKAKKKKAKKSRARTSEVYDDFANDVYLHSKISSNKLN